MTLRTHLDDTIVAVSTPGGKGGIGIVRLSGPEALTIADKIFTTKPAGTPMDGKTSAKPSAFPTHTVHHGFIVGSPSDASSAKAEPLIIDEVLLTVMRSPRSYTTEDVVEINCHAGAVALSAILRRAIEAGARMAEPGEFTRRAFLNGRIDLAQAEAVLDIIQAKTESFLKVSSNQLKGDLSVELGLVREELLAVYTVLEAAINFPEEEIDPSSAEPARPDGEIAPSLPENFTPALEAAKKRIDALLQSSQHGKVLREGIKLVICGKPNVGKSSLLNVLLKTPRAIVSSIAGTTRDTIEETAQIRGIPVQLVDTAGILSPRDVIEAEAVRRSHLSIQSADLVLFVMDRSVPITKDDEDIFATVRGQNVILVLNKSDLPAQVDQETAQQRFPGISLAEVSTLTREGIDDLEQKIVERVWHAPSVSVVGVMVTNMRHIQSLTRAMNALKQAGHHAQTGLSDEFVSEEIKSAIHELDLITGRDIDSDLLDQIFSQFCIGK